MRRRNFAVTLRAFSRRKPFRPLALELVNGTRIEIHHPEALRQQEDLLVYRSATGAYYICECTAVSCFMDIVGAV